MLQKHLSFRLSSFSLLWEGPSYFKQLLSCRWRSKEKTQQKVSREKKEKVVTLRSCCESNDHNDLHLPMCFSLSLNRASSEMASMEAAEPCSPANRHAIIFFFQCQGQKRSTINLWLLWMLQHKQTDRHMLIKQSWFRKRSRESKQVGGGSCMSDIYLWKPPC